MVLRFNSTKENDLRKRKSGKEMLQLNVDSNEMGVGMTCMFFKTARPFPGMVLKLT